MGPSELMRITDLGISVPAAALGSVLVAVAAADSIVPMVAAVERREFEEPEL